MPFMRRTLAVLLLVASGGFALFTGTATRVTHGAFEPCPCADPLCREVCVVD
jgi:hypothetical protein